MRVTRLRNRDETGAALLTVLLITMLITSLLGVVVVATAVNLRGSSLDRKRAQTAAAAEAGIDATLAKLQISTGTAVPCTGDPTLTGSVAGAGYTAKIDYYLTYPPSGSALSCSGGVLSATPLAALITSKGSTGTAPYSGAASSYGDRSMTALVRLTAGAASGPTFDKAVFSEGSVTLTNQWKLMNVGANKASLYTNGSFDCNSSAAIAGSVYAQGTGNMTNNCSIDGDLWTNGNITTSTNGVRVGGSIKSTAGGLTIYNHGIFIGNDVQVKTTCCGGTPNGITADSNPQTAPNGIHPGVSLATPPAESFPKIVYDPSAFPGFSVLPWATWEQTNATANGAPTWSSAYTGNCTAASADYSLNGPLVSPATPTIIDARNCSLNWNAVQVKLKSDLTIFTNAFDSCCGLGVTSADGANHTLRIIVPWPAAATTCQSSGAGTINFNSGGTALASNVQMLLYTPGTANLTNNIDFYGQVYGCTINASVNVTVRYMPVGAGGGSGGGAASPYKVDVAYLRDS